MTTLLEDVNDRIKQSVAKSSLAVSLDLKWQVNIMGLTMPDGNRAVMAQIITNTRSALIGQRNWGVFDLPIDDLLDDVRCNHLLWNLTQTLEQTRTDQARMTN